jgi:putative spermidine/putrescine transport system substrate-binding protein
VTAASGRRSHDRRAIGAFVIGVAVVVVACGPSTGTPGPSVSPPRDGGTGSLAPSSAGPQNDALSSLAKAAEAEGHLTTIGLPHDWCDYGEALKTFADRYAIQVMELSPDAGFADQLAAVRTNGTSAQAPDVIDVGRRFAAQARTEKLITPYKVTTWDDIPAALKDGAGFWYADYFAVLTFETNATVVPDPPREWTDLLAPTRRGTIALAGDPRVSDQAIQTVYAAALANGGSPNKPQAGLDFFAKLQTAGNLLPRIATQTTIDTGETPITIRWTTNALPHRDVSGDQPKIDLEVPTTGRLGDFSAQAISAFAPHPNAARLWMEFLYSDEGQNIFLKGDCQPARFDAMVAANAVPVELLAKAPDTTGTVFPTLAQLDAATALITKTWDTVVKVDIK